MGFLHNLKLRFSPPKLIDPDFGCIRFMFIANAPERSYWEGEWNFPNTGNQIFIGLPGGEYGPEPEGRIFCLGLPGRFDKILTAVRPKLNQVFQHWFEEELPTDLFTVVELTGFSVENLNSKPIVWAISFETTGDKWLGINIQFDGDVPQDAIVDT